MEATKTATNEFLNLDHPFRAEWIILFAVACAAILTWTLYRERAVLGSKTTWLFAVLRIVGLAAAFWMLLAPTNVVERSTSTRKAVLLLADTSASMTTIDPAGSADDRRWALAASVDSSPNGDHTLIDRADRAIAALGIASRELAGAAVAMQQYGAESLVAERLQWASTAITRCQTHLQAITNQIGLSINDSPESPSASQAPSQVPPLLNRLQQLLVSPEFLSLEELVDTLRRGRTPKESGWREALPDWSNRVATTTRVFRELADQLQQYETLRKPLPQGESSTSGGSALSTEFTNQSRSQRVAAFVRQFEQTASVDVRAVADVRWSVFDQSARSLRNVQEATGYLQGLAENKQLAKQTSVTAALQHVDQLQREQPIAATFVLSDAGHNAPQGRGPSDVAAQIGSVPVYMIPIGNEQRLRDVDLLSVSAPTVAMRNDDVVIEAHLAIYQCATERIVVQLLRGGEVVDFRNVTVDSNAETRSVQFQQRVSEVGTAAFQIAVQPLSGELTTENNFDEIEINVTRNEIKVLLADELPRWEYRYLAQLFRRDPKVELDELLFHPRMIATGQRQSSKTFPVTVDQWDHYDVVILGDLSVEHLPIAAQESLIEYLRARSGTLIMIAGQNAMPHAYADHPLHSILPVRPIDSSATEHSGQYVFRVTQAGKSHAALMIGETEQATRSAWEFINQFSPLDHVSPWRTPLPTAQSLISVVPRGQTFDSSDPQLTTSSFLCWQPVGRGRILYMSGPDTYRLRFLRGDRLHYRFWGQLMRWAIASDLAAGSKLVRIRMSKTLYESDDAIDAEVILLDSAGAPVANDEVTIDTLHLRLSAGDQLRTVPLVQDTQRPGHYRAEMRDLIPGVYQAQPVGSLVDQLFAAEQADNDAPLEKAIATFTVQANLPSELVDTRANRLLATQIAQATGGQVLPPTAVDEILALTDLQPVVTHTVQREPLWTRWWYLWLVFGCLQTEWTIRKWRGLS